MPSLRVNPCRRYECFHSKNFMNCLFSTVLNLYFYNALGNIQKFLDIILNISSHHELRTPVPIKMYFQVR